MRFYFDSSEFVGFCYTFEYKTSVYLAYLAVCPELRGEGYGSEIVDMVLGEYKHHNVFLTVEKEFGNIEEMRIRHRRREFYRHNGWRDTGLVFVSEGLEFNAFYVDSMIHEEDLHETLRYFEHAQRGYKFLN
ncbi:MAG: GNAT family N-acetyltransferase [archaeon]|nr:GNAT family N-acetyltransferase [archaeon]